VAGFVGKRERSPSLTGLRLRDRKDGSERILETDGAFVAIGHDPTTFHFCGQVEMTDGGYIKVAPWSTATSRKNVWSAGDVSDDRYKKAVVAAGMGCMAALEAEKDLAKRAGA